MANAVAITVNDLSANAGTALPSADVLDTGTAAVTLPLALGGDGADRLLILVKNTMATATLLVELLAGDSPPALRSSLGNLTVVAALAAAGTIVLGPVESARFVQTDGSTKGRLDLKFTPSTGTIGVSITAFRLPKAA